MRPRQVLTSLAAHAEELCAPSALSVARHWLIACGALESAATDRLDETDRNGDSDDDRAWRRVTMAVARVCVALAQRAPVPAPLHEVYHAVDALLRRHIPEALEVSAPEGYAYYSLYPDGYLYAAAAIAPALDRRAPVGVLGIRSIGTSLAAIVAAALEHDGRTVHTWSVRPTGHPFERVLRPPVSTAAQWRSLKNATWIVVDEGPGLSGSTLASVASYLTDHGASTDRIILMPHHPPDTARMHERVARIWQRVRVCPAPMEQWRTIGDGLWGDAAADYSRARAVGAGAWRNDAIWNQRPRPLVHPHHERSKWRTADGAWIKFAGLGWTGEDAIARARQLAEAEWGAPVTASRDGLIRAEHVAGTPAGVDADDTLVDWAGRYVTWTSHERRVQDDAAAAYARLTNAAIRTTSETLGDDAAATLARRVARACSHAARRPLVHVDARLFPHELIRTGDHRIVTVDGFEHGDDHFLPGPSDVLWDVVMCAHEFRLTPAQRRRLIVALPAEVRGDGFADLAAVYLSAYLAFRSAYTWWASRSLGDRGDGPAFGAAARAYSRALADAIQT